MELPALSLSESFPKLTTMLYRNMLAVDAKELLRGHPVDGVVLMGGSDKTTAGLLRGARLENSLASLSAAPDRSRRRGSRSEEM
jgi:dihydroxyacid dehydratase/phosphogluconate dehydratase